MNNYVFSPYDDKFPVMFQKEEERIRNILGNKPLIEHIGSTAVPGLGGKGVIDIYIIVPKGEMEIVSRKLQEELGYFYKENAGVADERLFHEIYLVDDSGTERHYHVHVTYPESQNYKEAIAFRDYLRKHPEEAKKYAEVKKKAVEEVRGLSDKKELKESYMAAKQDLIREMIHKALVE